MWTYILLIQVFLQNTSFGLENEYILFYLFKLFICSPLCMQTFICLHNFLYFITCVIASPCIEKLPSVTFLKQLVIGMHKRN